MKVAYIHLCDFALYGKDGKPSHIGIYSRILAGQMPAATSGYLAFGIEFDQKDPIEPFNVRIQFNDPGGKALVAIGGAATPQQLEPRGKLILTHQIVPLPPVALEHYGLYQIGIYLNSSELPSGTIPFEVAVRPGSESAETKPPKSVAKRRPAKSSRKAR